MPAENAGRAFALVLIDELVRLGMRHAVVAPGSRSTPIALALWEHPDVTLHVRIDERSAAYLALGLAKATGSIVPVLCTSGTAATYFHGAVMEADLSSVPLLILTADRPPELHGIGANQTVKQQGLYGDAVRWAPVIPVPESAPDSASQWRTLVRETVGHCFGYDDGPPGPVHLNLPLREPLIPIDDGVGFPYDLDVAVPASDPTNVVARTPPDELLRALSAGPRGVVVVGGWAGSTTRSQTAEVQEFATRAGWPVIAEPHSNARSGSLALCASDVLLRNTEFTKTHAPDIVLVVGRVGLSRTTLAWLETVPHVVVSPDGHHWDVTQRAAEVVTCGVDVLGSIEPAARDEQWSQDWLAASAHAAAAVDNAIDAGPPLSEPRATRDVAALLPDGAALVVSSSMPIRDLDLVMRPRDGLTVYANRGVSGIDGFVSSAVGIAIARGDRGPTVALCGDLSMLHDVNGLMIGDEPPPDLSFVVINNDGGGIFSLLPQGSAVEPAGFERLFGTPHGLDIANVARTYGVPHTLVTTTWELQAALATYGGLRIIEIRTDRADNAALHARLREISLAD